MSTCCSDNYHKGHCEHTEAATEAMKKAHPEKPVVAFDSLYGDGPTKCDNKDCLCHNWPKMNRHERRKFHKTGEHH